jgi:hypothetical protein
MRSQPCVLVSCDLCRDYEEEVELTTLARGAFDERNVDSQLEQLGWTIEAGEDICPVCTENIRRNQESET